MMANNNYSWNRDSVVTENSPEYSEEARERLGAHNLAFIKSLQTVPRAITDNIFKSIYASGILANTVLLVYILYYKRYRTPVFCVILSLGLADLGACLGGVLTYSFVVPFIQGPLWICPVVVLLINLSYLSSTYHIAVFAVLRFLQLVYPLASQAKVTTRLMFKICLTIWIIHSIQAAAHTLYMEGHSISTTGTGELYVCVFTGNARARSLWIIIYWVLVPFMTMSGLHVAKHARLVLSRSPTVTSPDDRVQQAHRRTDSRALAVVIAMYLLTVFPYLVQAFRINVFRITDTPIEWYLSTVFVQLLYTNSALNPWVYLFAAESVRSDIRKMFICSRTNSKDVK